MDKANLRSVFQPRQNIYQHPPSIVSHWENSLGHVHTCRKQETRVQKITRTLKLGHIYPHNIIILFEKSSRDLRSMVIWLQGKHDATKTITINTLESLYYESTSVLQYFREYTNIKNFSPQNYLIHYEYT